MNDPRLDLETQEIEAAISKKEQEILSVVFERLEQRTKTGHPLSLNATQVAHLWRRIQQTAAYVEYLEKLAQELTNTNKVLNTMIQDVEPKLKRKYRTRRADLPSGPRQT